MPYSIVSLNVDSIVHSGRRSQLTDFIRSIDPDVLMLQETKLDLEIRLRVDGYNIFRTDSRRGWAGTALLVRTSIPVRSVSCVRDPFIATSVECKLNGSWLRMVSTYMPHGMSHPVAAFDGLLTRFSNALIGGDLNARHPSFGDVSANAYGLALLSSTSHHHAHTLNPPSPTCYHAADGSYIDKFLLTVPTLTPSSISLLPSFSDHSAILITVPGHPNPPTPLISRRLFHLVDSKRLNYDLNRTFDSLRLPTDSPLADGDCEHAASVIQSGLRGAIERHVPGDRGSGHYMILSETARSLQRRSRAAQRRLHRNGSLMSDVDRRSTIVEVRLLRGMVVRRVQFELGQFFTNQYDSVTTQRDAYDTIRRFTGHKSRPTISGSLYLDANKTDVVAGAETLANTFADRFLTNHMLTINVPSPDQDEATRIVSELRHSNSRITFSPDIPASIPNRTRLDEIEQLLPPIQRGLLTTEEEVAAIIRERPNKKSCGADSIPYSIFKILNTSNISQLTIFFNHLISISYFPSLWRHAIIIPIPKSGKDHSLITNWRPISQLNCISKIFERIVAARLDRFNAEADLFPDQFGFLRGLSAEHALARLQSDVIEGLNTGRVTSIVALDLRSAFDTVWHDGLIMKLSRIGINQSIIRIIQSMISNRTFAVKIDNVVSSPRPMPAGVPQGSVLAPICFNYYIHDLPRSADVHNLQFADDTTIYKTHSDPGSAQNDINIHLHRLHDYFRDARLLLNPTKTEMLHIMGFVRDTNPRLRRRVRGMRVSMGGHLIRPASHIRLLGVRFQTNGRFVRHVDDRLRKASRAKWHVGRIIRNRFIEPRIKNNVYKQYLRAILTFGSPVWCIPPLISAHQMERLRVFERSALRSASNVRRERGSYMHLPASRLYELARCPRIDRHVTTRHIKFYQCIAEAGLPKLNDIVAQGTPGFYPPIDQVNRLHQSDGLLQNDRLLLFHQRYDDTGLVYNQGQ